MPPRRASTRNANARNTNAIPLVPDQGVSNAEVKNCPSRAQSTAPTVPKGHPTQQGNSSGTGGEQRQNRLYALQAPQDQEDSLDVITVICYFSFTLSCMLSTFQVLTHTCATSSRDVGSGSQNPDHA
uniref:Integrase core domain containing protein n=1 Tax=Solanum tuberosum TaxID=4113 RepID=M1DI89_SOLTU